MTSETHQILKDNIENIAEAIQDHLKMVTGGQILPFNLIIFTDGSFQTISNKPPEVMIPALQDAIEIYKFNSITNKNNAVIH